MRRPWPRQDIGPATSANGISTAKAGQPVAKDDPLNPGAFRFQYWFSVSTSDFYPTILAAAEISMPDGKPQPIDGINLLSLLEGKTKERPGPLGFMAGGPAAWSDNRYKLMAGRSVSHGDG